MVLDRRCWFYINETCSGKTKRTCVIRDHWEFQTDIRYIEVCECVHFDEFRQTGGPTKSIIGWTNYWTRCLNEH